MATLYSALLKALGALFSITSAFALALHGGAVQTGNVLLPTSDAASIIDAQSPKTIQSNLEAAHLPIASVTVKETPQATGTVVFIPQQHLSPGSNPMDSQNDLAVATQNQIAQIVDYLSKDEGNSFVMMEGEMYGPVPATSTAIVTQQLQARDSLTQAAQNIQHSCNTQLCAQAASGAQSIAAQLDREIALAGGAKAEKAAGGNFELWGAEDPSIQAQAGNIVRQYVYLDDRLSQLTGSDAASASVGGPMQPQGLSQAQPQPSSSNPLTQLIMASLQSNQSPTLNQTEISQLSEAGQQSQNTALVSGASELSQAFALANTAQSDYQTQVTEAAQGLPSRSDNPYAAVGNVQTLQSDMAQVENEITNTIVDERNAVASSHFAQGLSSTGATTGVLIYGAGHTSGLVQDLEAQHLNVVIVVPQALGSDQELQSALAS